MAGVNVVSTIVGEPTWTFPPKGEAVIYPTVVQYVSEQHYMYIGN
jgi:hypothetical protein